jgi:hypothetical protein
VADGEDEVLARLIETVLRGGSALIDDISSGRVRPLRQRVAWQIKPKAPIDRRDDQYRVGLSHDDQGVLLSLVIDAKAEDQQHHDLCATPCSVADL